jgi:hypothetical protein
MLAKENLLKLVEKINLGFHPIFSQFGAYDIPIVNKFDNKEIRQ